MHRFTGPPEGSRHTLVTVTLVLSLLLLAISILGSLILLVLG